MAPATPGHRPAHLQVMLSNLNATLDGSVSMILLVIRMAGEINTHQILNVIGQVLVHYDSVANCTQGIETVDRYE